MVRYKMLGLDVDLPITQYRTWVVEDEPDLTGQFYTGLKAGNNPLINISAYTIVDNSVVADFNFPLVNSYPYAIDWATTKKVLPEAVYEGQLAVIDGYIDGYSDGYDGYVYIFGGKYSNSILRARLSRPTEWIDTGSKIPNILSGSQIAIIGDRIYLFGGADTQSVDNIYSAPTNNPLDWTNHGSLLPHKLQNSQLVIADGYIYLLGGYSTTSPTNLILRASANDPLTWVDTGSTLPMPLYNSHAAIINNTIYLFGGQTTNTTPVNTILTAPVTNAVSWSVSGFSLPVEVFAGQFFTVGDKGYMIAPGLILGDQNYQTRIFQCSLSSPGQWFDTGRTVPGDVTYSHLAVIYDRIFLFGGNGSSIIFANNSLLKYNYGLPSVVAYGSVTRTQYNSVPTQLDLFKVLGFPPWKTDYGS